MSISTIMKQRRAELGLTLAQVAEMTGVTEATVQRWESGKIKTLNYDRLSALAGALRISPAVLAGLEPAENQHRVTSADVNALTPEEIAHIEKYRALNAHSRGAVDAILAYESRAENVVPLRQTKVIPLIGASFAAGPGEPDFGNGWEDYEVDADSRAEFALRVNGDSMEPVLHDGQIALGVKRPPEPGEVGAFLLDGEFLVKQCAGDNYGNVYLFSFNPAYEQIDVMASGERSLLCFGTVLLDRRYPLP